MSHDEPHVGPPSTFLFHSLLTQKLHSSVLPPSVTHKLNSLRSKENYDMGRWSIEGELSTPIVAKDEQHQVYGSGTSSGDHVCANSIGCDGGGES